MRLLIDASFLVGSLASYGEPVLSTIQPRVLKALGVF